MWLKIYYLFSYVIFFYSISVLLSYLYLVWQSYLAQRKLQTDMPDDATLRYMFRSSPITPAVSIIAPAFNEQATIINNVYSLLQIDYPKLEIIIVNDASTDNTLDLLIEEFKLVKVPYTNSNRVPSKPIKSVYRSTEKKFNPIVVVDKEHGGRKSDGSNAGINICSNKYFICTDVDCIVEPMALYRMMWLVINSHEPMIGVSATMLMLNGCTVENGRVTEAAVANNPLPWFQQLEYMRSFLVGKLGWSNINTLPNISGGFGLFDTDVVVKSGGYDPTSMAEDVDMLLRMVTYMNNDNLKFRVAQVPKVCCWTEGPFTIRSMYRQRIRWARGLCEIVSNHRKLFFNPHYGKFGAFVLPYIFLFEFIAPILEVSGFIFTIWLILIGGVNWRTAFVILGMVYALSLLVAFFVILLDYSNKNVSWKHTGRTYSKLMLAAVVEPFIYHPFITFCSIIGYWNFLRNSTAVWQTIQRQGVRMKKKTENNEAANSTQAQA